MNRIIEYDVVRVFAVFLVILGHSSYYSLKTRYGGVHIDYDPSQISTIHTILSMVINVIYKFHMSLFMALSGAVFSLTLKKGEPTFKKIVQKKWRRIMIPMILTTLLFSVPIKYFSGYWTSTNWDLLKDIIAGQLLMYGSGASHLWFLQALFWIFILSWFIEHYRLRSYKFAFPIILLMLYLFSPHIVRFLNIHNACTYLLWFYVGFEFDQHREIINSFLDKISAKHLLYLLPCFFWLANATFSLPYNFCDRLVQFFISLFGICISYFICYKLSKINKISNSKLLTGLAAASFGLYLYSDPLNYPIISFVKSHGLEYMLYDNTKTLLLYTFRFSLTFCLAWVVTLGVNRLKYHRVQPKSVA